MVRIINLLEYLKDYVCDHIQDNVSCIQQPNPEARDNGAVHLSSTIAYARLMRGHMKYILTLTSYTKPSSYEEASKDLNWRKTTHNELQALEENKT